MTWHLPILIVALSILYCWGLSCNESHNRMKFYLEKPYHRSLTEKLHVANVDTLESCMQLAKSFKGLALNYGPEERYLHKTAVKAKIGREHYWKQPQLYFNCHVLQCPENTTYTNLVNDTQFDYYSLYEGPIATPNYICIPEVGIFVIHDTPETFQNASQHCHNSAEGYCGTLAHIASASRTITLTQALHRHNQQQTLFKLKPKIYLAYVGLYYNRTQQNERLNMFNMEGDNLKCFRYRAWEPGNPKTSAQFKNSSCVALTSHGTWLTVNCQRKLPYICEIFTKCDTQSEEL